jgi:cephalosporin hydroxylase
MAESNSNKTPAGGQPPAAEILRLANIIYFRSQVFDHTEWMGHKAAKCPMDMWVYQELMHKLKTDLLIETGTLFGGSALFFAQMFDLMGRGKVISIDIELRDNLPQHPRIEYIEGSSVATEVLGQVAAASDTAESVVVLLDSDHKAAYKQEEMRLYSGFVTPGSYMIAEDTCFDAYPAFPEYGPGPATAVREFMAVNSDFEVDHSLERHLLTFVPGGFLRRK